MTLKTATMTRSASPHGGTDIHYLMAASMMVIAPVVVLFFLTQKTFIPGMATAGMKG